MAGTTNRVELYPFSPPQKLERPDGLKTAAVSVDFGGNAVRLLVKEGSAGELTAAGKPPGGEYSAILTVAGDSWSSETPVSELTVALPQIERLPENEILQSHLAADATATAAKTRTQASTTHRAGLYENSYSVMA